MLGSEGREQVEGLEDEADPLAPENRLKTSGRGIFYMRTFMDQIRYSFDSGGGTSLIMTKNLAKGSGIASGKA